MPTCQRLSQAALSALLVVACLYALAQHRGERLRRNKLNRHHHGSLLPDEYGGLASTRGPLNIEDDGIMHAYAAKRSRSRSRPSPPSVWEALVGEALDHPALDPALDPAALVPASVPGDSTAAAATAAAAAAAAATHPPIRPSGEHHKGDRVDVRIPGGRPGPPLLYEAATVVSVSVPGLTVDVQYAVDGAVEKGVDVAVVRQRTGKGKEGGGRGYGGGEGREEGEQGERRRCHHGPSHYGVCPRIGRHVCSELPGPLGPRGGSPQRMGHHTASAKGTIAWSTYKGGYTGDYKRGPLFAGWGAARVLS